MAQSGYTPIQLYHSTTSTNIPASGNLVDGELAINTADEKLYFKNSAGTVKLLAASITPVLNGGTGTSNPSLVPGSGVTISGSWPNQTVSATGTGGTVTSVGLNMPAGFSVSNSPVTSSGTLDVTTSLSGVLKGTGSAFTAATPGTDYVAPGTDTSFTGLQTFSGTSSNLAAKLLNAKEAVTVSATAATGTINFDVTVQSVLFYTTDASGNWTLNVRASAGTSLDSALSVGESVTIAFLVTQGVTAYYQSGFEVDGVPVTPQWQGGVSPSSGNASGVDIYAITIIKTASATFSAFVSQTNFA